MASTQDIQTLLRFLSQDAKIPLGAAMGKIKDLQAANLVTPHDIAKTDIDNLQQVIKDDKLARQILNAAKRVSKKRTNSDLSTSTIPPSPAKKKAKPSLDTPIDPDTFEASLALPEIQVDEQMLKDTVVHTNRAPLLLAFATTLLKYTLPAQPLSTRLSLAQAVCSANSQSKAKYLGVQRGTSAEDEGWGEGQPVLTVMGREIRVMKRWGYAWQEGAGAPTSTQDMVQAESQEMVAPAEPALWGVDLEALKKANGPVIANPSKHLPIYRPEATRAYLLKSFAAKSGGAAKPATGKKAVEENERNLGMLLAALDLLYRSWDPVLSQKEMDKRAWGWYCSVRPEVKSGLAGWGGKGDVKLADILQLSRPAD